MGITTHVGTEIFIIIPAFNEAELTGVLESIAACTDRECAEVIVVINDAVDTSEEVKIINERSYVELSAQIDNKAFGKLDIHLCYMSMIPNKRAGVGLARRIGMQEAVNQYAAHSRTGIIASLDADCEVSSNYITTQLEAYHHQPDMDAFTIHFEHPIAGNDAIVDYELHLRIYMEWQRQLLLPWAFHTIGSSFSVRSMAYQAQGGMPVRQAGEDFYFLHKFSVIHRLGVLNATTVYPSGRPSDRVPFGTGRAVEQIESGEIQMTYNGLSFIALRSFTDQVNTLFDQSWKEIEDQIDADVLRFLKDSGLAAEIAQIKRQTRSREAFRKRLFQTFSPFKLMKYLHYMRDHHYPDLTVQEGGMQLLHQLNVVWPTYEATTLLRELRNRQKQWKPEWQDHC